MGRRPTAPEKKEWAKSLLHDGHTVREVSKITEISESTVKTIKEEDIADFWIQHELEWEDARMRVNGNRKKSIRNPENGRKWCHCKRGHCG